MFQGLIPWNIKFSRKIKLKVKEGISISNTLKNLECHLEDLRSISIWIWQTLWEPSVRMSSRRFCRRFLDVFVWQQHFRSVWATKIHEMKWRCDGWDVFCSSAFIWSISPSSKTVLFCLFYLILQHHPGKKNVEEKKRCYLVHTNIGPTNWKFFVSLSSIRDSPAPPGENGEIQQDSSCTSNTGGRQAVRFK